MKIELVQVCRRPQWPLWAVLVVLVWFAIGGAAVFVSMYVDRTVSLCLFKRLTGFPCPSCGFARGGLCLLQGHIWQAWLYNPLVFSALAVFFVTAGVRVVFARRLRIQLTQTERAIAWILAITILFANWVYVILYVG